MAFISYLLLIFISWLLNQFGKDIVGITKDKVQSWFRSSMEGRNIIVLGPKQSGKTSLIAFIQHGTPYEVENGKIKEPEPTFGALLVDKVVNVSTEQKERIKAYIHRDVGGEKRFAGLWKEMIEVTKPEGIIYTIDGSKGSIQFKEDCERIESDILSSYIDRNGDLKTIHIFINFMDKWSDGNRQKTSKMESTVRYYMDSILMKKEYRKISNITVGVYSIQLSPKSKSWNRAKTALNRFGADIKSAI